MTKKLILLILALPLFLMIILFTATAGVSLAVPIAVTGIEISGDETIYINMDNPNAEYTLEYAVYPTNAANKTVTVSYESVEGEEYEAKLEYDTTTGALKPLTAGAVDVIVTTVDGGYTDRIRVIVETKELVSISSDITSSLESGSYDQETGKMVYDDGKGNAIYAYTDESKNTVYEMTPNTSIKISTSVYPESASNTLVKYESSNTSVATVKANGLIETHAAGTAVITVISRANEHITSQFIVKVQNPGGEDFYIPEDDIKATSDEGEIVLSVTYEGKYDLEYKILDAGGKDVTDDIDIGSYLHVRVSSDNTIEYFFNGEELVGRTFTIVVTVTYTEIDENGNESVVTKELECKLTQQGEKAETGEIKIVPEEEVYSIYLQNKEVFFEIYPLNSYKNIEVNVITNDKCIFTLGDDIEYYGDSLYSVVIEPKLVGVGKITIVVTDKDTGNIITKDIDVIIKPSRIVTSQPSLGIEKSYTIGKYNADGSLFEYILSYTISGNIDESFYKHIEWISDNEAVTIDKNGKIVFEDDVNEFVTFNAVFSYAGVEMKSQSIKIRCISNGYNVYNYKQLVAMTNAENVVVLQSDIVNTFGKDGDSEEKSGSLLATEKLYTTIQSTYDITWYKNFVDKEVINNSELKEVTSIKVLISFKESVYGNGHIINANNVVGIGQNLNYTSTGQPYLESYSLFRGPLYFVSVSSTPLNTSLTASVAAQDNIAFAVYENVTLNNIELVSRDMAPDTSGNANLQNLHYAGTTLEVLGDNIVLEYSRVRNGRNVIRAFGDIKDNEKVITFTVKNCVLSQGRDFIMRIGTNCFVQGNSSNPSPYLVGDSNGTDYAKRHNYASLSDTEKANYDTKYIKTNVILQNTVLQNPGIFAIGMDSHFAGTALNDASAFSKLLDTNNEENQKALISWYNLAKTSYGVKLTFEGEVRMYCWKTLNSVDSSSLIEVADTWSNGMLDKNTLSFDIATLVPAAVKSNSNLKNVIKEYKGENDEAKTDYIHAGIAFFGGGKNYSVLEDSNYSFRDYNHYEISLVDVGAAALQVAAGTESFYFFIHDATTVGFLPADQEALLKSEDACSCIYKTYTK